MKNKIFILMLAIVLLGMIPIQAEMTLFNNVVLDQNLQSVNYHIFYSFEDTSAKGIGSGKDVPIILAYSVQSLPLTLTYGNIDYCNMSITHFHNIYGTTFSLVSALITGGLSSVGVERANLLNTTINFSSYYFTSGSNGELLFNMRDKDTLSASMTCHYTDVRSLYEENVLGGRFTTFMPSFECDRCTQYSLEQLSQETNKNLNVTSNQLGIYTLIQNLVGYNFQAWLIGSWIVKIGFVFVALVIIFATGYFFYSFLNKLSQEI